jgi:hypothetical protein
MPLVTKKLLKHSDWKTAFSLATRYKPYYQSQSGSSSKARWGTTYHVDSLYTNQVYYLVGYVVYAQLPNQFSIYCNCSKGVQNKPCEHMATVMLHDNALSDLVKKMRGTDETIRIH